MTQSLDAIRAVVKSLEAEMMADGYIAQSSPEFKSLCELVASLSDQSAGDGWKDTFFQPDSEVGILKVLKRKLAAIGPNGSISVYEHDALAIVTILEAYANKLSASPIPVDRRAVLKLPISQLEAFTSSGADCHPESPHAVVWKLIPARAASPSLAAPASKGPMEADIERAARALVKQGLFYGNGECLFEVDDAMDLARAALGAMQHE